MFLGIILTIALIIAISLIAGRKATAENFATGGRNANTWIVCGTLMGTIISGQATVGTAQLAFSFGISAWWFTIGAAIGVLLLGLFFVRPLRHSGSITLMEIIGRQYGRRVETVGSCLCVIGIFISIVAQIIASSALIATLFPGVGFVAAAVIAMLLMLIYVVFGGLLGAGLGGIVKTSLLYLSAAVAGITVWHLSGGLGPLMQSIAHIHTSTPLGTISGIADASQLRQHYGNILARGPLHDLGSCLALVLGVLSTQTYAQALWAGRTDRAARHGALLSALLIPPIGAACTLVGLYMRAHYVTADEYQSFLALGAALPSGVQVLPHTVQAFPLFVTHHLPGFFGGVVLGTLIVTIVGGGSGLTLGAATILVRDLFEPLRRRRRPTAAAATLGQQRLVVVVLLLIAVAVSATIRGTFLNDLGFLSLGLRATAVLVPLIGALAMPGRLRPSTVLAATIAGTLMLLVAQMLHLPADPVFYGMGLSILITAAGCLWHPRSAKQ